MKKTLAAITLTAAFALTPVHAEGLDFVSLDAVEQAIAESNVKGKEFLDNLATNVVDGVSKVFSFLESDKD